MRWRCVLGWLVEGDLAPSEYIFSVGYIPSQSAEMALQSPFLRNASNSHRALRLELGYGIFCPFFITRLHYIANRYKYIAYDKGSGVSWIRIGTILPLHIAVNALELLSSILFLTATQYLKKYTGTRLRIRVQSKHKWSKTRFGRLNTGRYKYTIGTRWAVPKN